MNLAEINEVIKASPAIQIQSKISLLQRRAWNVLLANAYNELPDKDVYSVSIMDLTAKLGFNSRDYDYLKGVLKSIVDCKVEWNVLARQRERMGRSEPVSRGAYSRWYLFLSVSPYIAAETPQPTRLRQVEPATAKPIQEPICVGFMGSLFRLL